MTQILVTIDNNSWLGKIISAISMIKGVVKTEVKNENTLVSNSKPTLDDVCGSWKGNTSEEETLKAIYEARSTNMN